MENVRIRSTFWSVFSCIQIEYGDLDSVRMQKNTDQRKPDIGQLSPIAI